MSYEHPSQEQIKQLLNDSHTIAVVGLSDDPSRTSNMVSQAMKYKGYRIIPVNPKADRILGETCYKALQDIPEPIDIVNVFRRSEFCLDVAKEAVAVGAKAIWMQQGVINEEAAAYASAHGLQVVMDSCIKVMDAILLPKGKQ